MSLLSTAIESLNNDLGNLIQLQEQFDDSNFYNDVVKGIQILRQNIVKATHSALLRLDQSKPSKATLAEIVQSFPSSLVCRNRENELPVETLFWNKQLEYSCVLMQEGSKYQIGGDPRGGLFLPVRSSPNEHYMPLIQWLALNYCRQSGSSNETDWNSYDIEALKLLKTLTETNLFQPADVFNFNLLYWSCHENARLRFDYFVQMNPGALTRASDGTPLIHKHISIASLERFKIFIRASLRYFPHELGLLLQRNLQNITAVQQAFARFGKDVVLDALEECIPEGTKIPILHIVWAEAPLFFNDFFSKFPHCFYERDAYDRSFLQVALVAGNLTFLFDSMFFVSMSEDEQKEKDPLTGLYPFLSAAAYTRDLSVSYYLLRVCPSLIEDSFPHFEPLDDALEVSVLDI